MPPGGALRPRPRFGIDGRMAQTSTVYVFDLTVSDMDRGVYENLSLKVARHPSETAEYLVTRVLAYALELQEGLSFSQGLCVSTEPALWVHDLTGALQAWIEVGAPEAPRLHKARKACGRVTVYCHKDVPFYLRSLAGQKIHEAESVEVVELKRTFIGEIAAKLDKRNTLSVVVTEGQLYVDLAGASFSSELARFRLGA